MLSIEQLNMKLPSEYADRAQAIAEQLGQLLGEMDHRGIKNRAALVVPAIQIETGAGSDAVALQIAGAIINSLGTER